jgi:enoyl-CoA hydratase/carnithine racemase
LRGAFLDFRHGVSRQHKQSGTQYSDLFDGMDTAMQVVLCGNGKNFCAGIDLALVKSLWIQKECHGRRNEELRRTILKMQDSLTALEQCRWPVIAAVDGTLPMQNRMPCTLAPINLHMTSGGVHEVPTILLGLGACIGAGVDMITAADIRYCTNTASFCVKEADLAITADMGTLQRLPGIVGDGALPVSSCLLLLS